MELKFYVTVRELLDKGGKECEITHTRPTRGQYLKVLTDSGAFACRGANYVFYKDTELAYEIRRPAAGKEDEWPWENMDKEPTVGLLNDAKEYLEEHPEVIRR